LDNLEYLENAENISAGLYKSAYEAIVEFDEDRALSVLREARDKNADLMELLSRGYSAGMKELGDRFGMGEIFLPELMMCTAVMQKVSAEIDRALAESGGAASAKKARIVLGTVAGDVHDIGKGIVCSLLRSNGYEVYDLGREVPARAFVDKAEEYGARYIGSSALLTTTMTEQNKIEDILKKEGLRDKYKTLVGGAPVTCRWAEKIGADAYCEDAAEAVALLDSWNSAK